MTNNNLFSEFAPVSAKQWKQKIQVDLKGADYNDTLIWQSPEGIDVKPFYTKEDSAVSNLPKPKPWHICQTIFVADVEKSNAKALNVLQAGVDSIKFIIPSEVVDLDVLLKGLPTETLLYFDLEFLSKEFTVSLLKKRSKNTFVLNDIIGHLARSGNWFFNLKQDHETLENIIKNSPENTLSVDVGLYQNAGANMVQQLAYALAHVNEYFNHFGSKLKGVTFQVSVGSNYFFEIAKLRSLRVLYAALAEEYGIDTNCHITAVPTKRNKTLYDYNTNMLRTTTECMSAVLGGADTVNNLAYDAIYHKDNAFGERIARNQLLILKHESHFNAENNPADGAFYIEELTAQLSEKALELFKAIEKGGGFLKQLKDSTIQKKIKESANKEQAQFDEGELVLLGTNKHPNKDDKMKSELELYPFVKIKPRKTLIEPIIEKRLAEKTEQERLKTE